MTITKQQHMLILMVIGGVLGWLFTMVGLRGLELYVPLIVISFLFSMGLGKYVNDNQEDVDA